MVKWEPAKRLALGANGSDGTVMIPANLLWGAGAGFAIGTAGWALKATAHQHEWREK